MTGPKIRQTCPRPTTTLRARACTLFLMLAAVFALAMPAAASCVYPSVPAIDAPPPPLPGQIDGIAAGPNARIFTSAGAVRALQIGCIIFGPPPLPPPCAPERGDCFLPITPPDLPPSGHHDKDRICGKLPSTAARQKHTPHCSDHPQTSFNTSGSIAAQWV